VLAKRPLPRGWLPGNCALPAIAAGLCLNVLYGVVIRIA
jgi:hypothetical protein